MALLLCNEPRVPLNETEIALSETPFLEFSNRLVPSLNPMNELKLLANLFVYPSGKIITGFLILCHFEITKLFRM
jgi:hypothetical protein